MPSQMLGAEWVWGGREVSGRPPHADLSSRSHLPHLSQQGEKKRSLPPLQSCSTRVPGLANPNLLGAIRDCKPGRETGKVDGGKGPRCRDAECGVRWTQGPSFSCPLRSRDLFSRLQCTDCAGSRGRAPCPHLPPLGELSSPKPRARVARALGTPRRTREKEFSISPWATQDGTCPLGGEALPWRLRGHAGRAPRPEDAAPAQPRLALVFREPGPSPGEGTPRVRSPFLVSALTFRLLGTLGTAQHRPSPPTRPTCPLLVWVKSLRQLPERTLTAASREAPLRSHCPHGSKQRNRGGWSPFPPRATSAARCSKRGVAAISPVFPNFLWGTRSSGPRLGRDPGGERIRVRSLRGPSLLAGTASLTFKSWLAPDNISAIWGRRSRGPGLLFEFLYWNLID